MTDRSPEVDFDAFGPTTLNDERDTQTIPPEPFAAAVDAARAEHNAVVEEWTAHTLDQRPPTKNVTPTPTYPIAVIWGSRTGGAGHVCAIIGTTPEGVPVLRCTCEAGILGSHDCWAMTATRRIL